MAGPLTGWCCFCWRRRWWWWWWWWWWWCGGPVSVVADRGSCTVDQEPSCARAEPDVGASVQNSVDGVVGLSGRTDGGGRVPTTVVPGVAVLLAPSRCSWPLSSLSSMPSLRRAFLLGPSLPCLADFPFLSSALPYQDAEGDIVVPTRRTRTARPSRPPLLRPSRAGAASPIGRGA